jgi:hypothetical protein
LEHFGAAVSSGCGAEALREQVGAEHSGLFDRRVKLLTVSREQAGDALGDFVLSGGGDSGCRRSSGVIGSGDIRLHDVQPLRCGDQLIRSNKH